MSDSASTPPAAPKPAAPDRHQVERLNDLWAITKLPVPEGRGIRGRLSSAVRRMMIRYFLHQEEFNAAIVDHLNRNLAVTEDMSRASIQIEELANEMVEEMRPHREVLLARDRRNHAAVTSIAATQEELRAAVGVLQQASQNLKREIQQSRIGAGTAGAEGPGQAQALPPAGPASQFDALDSHKYVGFEDQFRGTPDDIRRRVAEYLPTFAGTSDVLDIGCGRGEFLELLREQGITARGIDLNPAMVDVCLEHGLAATAADALTYLRAQADGSLGGIFAAQVVEHLEPRYLTQLLDAAFDKLRPGAPIVLETINPACWFAFFESYIRDITHVRPLHPDTLKYLLIASGFQQLEIRYRAPYPEHEKLQPVPGYAEEGGGALTDWADTINANVEKINRLLFTWLDYAAIGRRS